MLSRIRHAESISLRQFSTSSRVQGRISHIGRTPIPIPSSVVLTMNSADVTVQGPLGITAIPIKPFMRFENPQTDVLAVSVEDPGIKQQRQMWGLTRTLIHNTIIGMSEGFTLPVHLVGVGYRAALEQSERGDGQRLHLKLGFSHSVYEPVPAHIKVEVPLPTRIVLSCTDKHLLGLYAAKIRRWRPPEPYKGKGVFVGNEVIRIKQVKKK